MFSKLLRYFVIASCASLAAVTPARAQSPATAPVVLANGTWTIQGREIPGTRCGHWLVRLLTYITSVRLNCEQIQLVALDVIVGFVVSSGNRVTKQHFFEERH